MSLVKLGDGVVDINGKIGGDIFRNDLCGKHVQATPRRITQEPRPNQKKQRRAFRRCINYVRQNMTAIRSALWQQHANLHPITNKKGEKQILSWWQMFLKYNLVRLRNDLDILEDPPE